MRTLRPASLASWLRWIPVLFITLSLCLAVPLSIMTSSLSRSVSEMERLVEGARVAGELQSELLNHVRLYGLVVAFGRQHYGSLNEESEARVRALLAQAEGHVGSATERELLARVVVELESALSEMDDLARTTPPLDVVLRRSGPRLEPVLASVEELQAINAEQAGAMASRAARLNETADLLAISLFAVISLTAVLIAILAHRYVSQPLRRLSQTLRLHARGETRPLEAEEGPPELRDVARAINELSQAGRRRRDEQMEVLAGVVHDLNNPLVASRMLLPVLARAAGQGDGSTAARVVELLDRQMVLLRDLTGDLLDAARVEAGGLRLDMRQVDLGELLHDAAEIVQRGTERHRVEVKVPEAPVLVPADGRRLSQVIRNLLDNAVKYSPSGGRVLLTLSADSAGAILSVSDQGMGISQEDLPSLFRPFWRAARVRSGIPGTGLGLSVVHKIVTAHGGTIDVESRTGQGTTVRIRLPREPGQAAVTMKAGMAPR